jgi:hydrogenase maturation protease
MGSPGEHGTMLCSPIILYDYPQVAPERTSDFFDGTERDELLVLRILTLTDEEKLRVAALDARGGALLRRTAAMDAEQIARLHGAVRSLRPMKDVTDEP